MEKIKVVIIGVGIRGRYTYGNYFEKNKKTLQNLLTLQNQSVIMALQTQSIGGVKVYNYSKLLGRIKEKGFTLEALAKKIGLNVSTLSKKLNNKSEFHQDEIKKICRVIDIEMCDIGTYFFCQEALVLQSDVGNIRK